MSEILDRVAAAISPLIQDIANGRPLKNMMEITERQVARAAIEAMRVPTAEMVVAVLQTSARDVPAERMWQAMIDEALK